MFDNMYYMLEYRSEYYKAHKLSEFKGYMLLAFDVKL